MKNNANTPGLIKQVKDLILKGNAHATLDHAVKNIPEAIRGIVPDKLPYSLWQIVEHIRITQWDILDFSRNPAYKEIEWPADYWPKNTAPKDNAEWEQSIKRVNDDRNEFVALLE